MIVLFYEPPPAKKAGGVERAIRSLQGFLQQRGVAVRCNAPVEELGSREGEVVHFHGLWQPEFLRISAHCRHGRIPYVVSPHGMLEPWAWRHKRWKKWLWYHLFEHRHLSGASRLLATSEVEARNLGRYFPSADRRALPLGVTAEHGPDYEVARRKLGWSESEVVLLYLSRIHPKKGLDILLRALTGLDLASAPKVRLAIVGEGEARYVHALRSFGQRESRRLPRVDWLGEIWGNDKWPYLQGADLFCLPSHSENFGLAILEALQVGTRVLTTDRTPWDMLPSWEAGIIVPPEESAIRAALNEFLRSTEWSDAQRMALASKVSRQFSWEAVGPAYLRLYEEITASLPPQRDHDRGFDSPSERR